MEMKDADKKAALGILSFRVISFDLEAILSVPFTADCQIYFKRKKFCF